MRRVSFFLKDRIVKYCFFRSWDSLLRLLQSDLPVDQSYALGIRDAKVDDDGSRPAGIHPLPHSQSLVRRHLQCEHRYESNWIFDKSNQKSFKIWKHLDSDPSEAGPAARVEARGVRLVGLGALPPAIVHFDEAVSGANAKHGEEDEEGDAVDVGRLAALEVNIVFHQLEAEGYKA